MGNAMTNLAKLKTVFSALFIGVFATGVWVGHFFVGDAKDFFILVGAFGIGWFVFQRSPVQ